MLRYLLKTRIGLLRTFTVAGFALMLAVDAAPSPGPTPAPVVRAAPIEARAATVTRQSSIFTLAPTFVVTSATTTRTFNLELSLATGAPDGYSRQMMVINGQYPAPLIECNEGDTLVVNVKNSLPTGNGIHWHGMLQAGTNWADGVPGISQCPIPAGQTFQYKFTVANQYGTYWYHSHMGNTMADGIVGPLIIHSPSEPLQRGRDYDYDQILMLGDWMHDQSDLIVSDLLGPTGYRSSFAAPVPDALLLNGVGVYNCSGTTDPCKTQTIPDVPVIPNARYRFRVINHSSHIHYKFSIDNHPLSVIAMDGIPMVPKTGVHQLPIGVAQRYDVLVNTTAGTSGSAFYVRAAMCAASIASVPTDYDIFALAALRYTSTGSPLNTAAPTSTDWSDSNNADTTCQDFPDGNLVPFVKQNAPTSVLDSVILSSSAGTILNSADETVVRFFWNSVTWTNYIYQPLLFKIQNGTPINDSIITHHTFSGNGGADIIVNNLDAFIDHPYHLHGNPFYLVARGAGALTAAGYATLSFNTTNPPRRDVVTVPRSTYAVLRIITNDPGVWPLHCHIGWHLAAGKMAAIIVQPTAITAELTPPAAVALCAASNIPAGDTLGSTAPGKRASYGENLARVVRS